jgi:hypothetical protein
METLISVEALTAESKADKEIQLVSNYVIINSWPEKVPQNLKPFKTRKDELLVDNGILMW